MPDERWVELAQVALEEGIGAGEIAAAAFHGHHTFRGHGTDYWSEWEAAFDALESDAPPGIREVARHGQDIARRRLQDSQARERHEQLHGR
jgi:hypothetical protein